MSARLRDLLDDLAADAHGYGDPDAAVATARRRVAVRRAAVPLAAAVVVALVALLASPAVRDRFDSGPDIGATPDPYPDYPDRVTVPERAEPLPEWHLNQAASFIYAPCPRTCDAYLVMPDGTQHRLRRPDIGPPTYGYSLSPDGRWLGRPTASGFELRDLVDGRAISISDTGPGVTNAWVWAPDSRSVLLARHQDGAVDHYLLWSLYDQSSRRVETPPIEVVAMRNTGDLVGWVSGGGPDQLPVLGLVPRGQSIVAEQWPVHLPPGASGDLFRPGERFSGAVYLDPTGDNAALVVNAAEPRDGTHWPSGVVFVDLSAGARATTRLDLSVTTGAGAPDWHVWEVANNPGGGLLLLHWQQGRTEVVRLDDVNGSVSVATVLPADAQVSVRGDGRY
jgi:hypothetical protein